MEKSTLPDLPEWPQSETLAELDATTLETLFEATRTAEQATLAAMAPYDRQLKELRARLAQVATEKRRRERGATVSQRREVREQAASGELPTLGEALAASGAKASNEINLAELQVFLRSGGEVRLGFPGRPGQLSFTDGRQARIASTWNEACAAYLSGWEPGTAQVPGVRVHLLGTKVERVVGPDEIVVRLN